MQKKSNAFTLIELLIVIAIISLLAAILFPVFAGVRERARQSSCASNLKQIGFAVMQYTQDNDEMMPPVVSRTCLANASFVLSPVAWQSGGTPQCGAGTQHPGWMEAIYSYVKNKSLFICPSDYQSKLDWNSSTGAADKSSYGMNYFLGWSPKGTVNYSGTGPNYWGSGSAAGSECDQSTNSAAQSSCGDSGYPIARIPRAAEIVLMTEFGANTNLISGGGQGRRADYYYFPFYYGPFSYANPLSGNYCTLGTSCSMRVATSHASSTNFLFVDGHVKAEKVQGNTVAFDVTASTEWLPLVGNNTNPVLDAHWHPDK